MTHEELVRAVIDGCLRHRIMLSTAESCTGGMIIAALTDIAGSSAVVDRGFVTYSNDAKLEMLGVLPGTLDRHGAVSEETALEMAVGALSRSRSGMAISVTGIAGPGGGSVEKPVGLVWFGLARHGAAPVAEHKVFSDEGRASIRKRTVEHALTLVHRALG